MSAVPIKQQRDYTSHRNGIGDQGLVEIIARETGFRDRRHMCEVFIRGFGVPPQSMRRDIRAGG